jgi:hypothetical protein
MVITTKHDDKLLGAIGSAVKAYTSVEAAQSALLAELLGLGRPEAGVVFFTIQNVRSRNEMYGALLELKYGKRFSVFWDSCSDYLNKLAVFRNALVHWHPMLVITVSPLGDPSEAEPGLRNPMPGRRGSLKENDLEPFESDCIFIREALFAFRNHLSDIGALHGPSTSPQKFLSPLSRRNRAVLQPRPMPKAPQAPPRSSRA